MSADELIKRITSSPDICHGKPCIRGLRYPVEFLLELLLVSNGNIANRDLLGLFEAHLKNIVAALDTSNFVEITVSGLILHD